MENGYRLLKVIMILMAVIILVPVILFISILVVGYLISEKVNPDGNSLFWW